MYQDCCKHFSDLQVGLFFGDAFIWRVQMSVGLIGTCTKQT